MHHYKLILFGVVLAVAIIFGFIFWGDLLFNQQELSNTPMEVTTDSGTPTGSQMSQSGEEPALSSSDDLDAMEKDLEQTSLEIDQDMADLEAELGAL